MAEPRETPQLTVRAVVTGLVLGALLAPANLYAGLKVGWAFNMAVTSALLSYGFWGVCARFGARPMNLLENNVNQVVASAGAMIASAGLVAAVPALSMLTGYEWSFLRLSAWTLCVSLVGVACALVTRHQLLVRERLPFPSGIATATTLAQMYARGREAQARLRALLASGVLAATVKALVDVLRLRALPLPGAFALPSSAHASARITLGNLGFAFDPSLLMVAVGALVGLRAGLSMLLGALLGWGLLAPQVVARGWVDVAALAAREAWYGTLVNWMLWPGVALMVSAALTSLASAWLLTRRRRALREAPACSPDEPAAKLRRTPIFVLVVVAFALSISLQRLLFDIDWTVALLGSALTFVLATVAARVTGETDITPIGAMGQLTQLAFGLIAPGQVAPNLMAANVTGGAASQCADLMQDLKSGQLLGASPRKLAVAQLIGIVGGALSGSGAYLLLVRDPTTMLLSADWPAPAVATWRAAALLFAQGLGAAPPLSLSAMAFALILGCALALAERLLPPRAQRFVPSPASLGLALVIPASYAMSMCAGALLAHAATRSAPAWSERFVLAIAAGAIAGESLTGVFSALAASVPALLSR